MTVCADDLAFEPIEIGCGDTSFEAAKVCSTEGTHYTEACNPTYAYCCTSDASGGLLRTWTLTNGCKADRDSTAVTKTQTVKFFTDASCAAE
jgi:hypothetical protein